MADPVGSIPGVASGIDWKSFVDQIITLERQPATRMQATIDANTKRKAALLQFQAAVNSFKSAADALKSNTPFETFSASAIGADAGGRNVLAATVAAGATGGSYTIQVTGLASAQKATGGVALAPAATLPAGTLSLSRPGNATPLATVDVVATDTLATLRDKINAKNTGTTPTGVQASVVNVSATEQRLVLTSTSPGTANGFTLGDDGASGLVAALGMDPADADTTRRPIGVAAADAHFTVDGLAITQPTNSVAGVIPGVTLSLSALGTSALTVTRQDSATTNAVQGFVDSYNNLRKFISTNSAANGPLAAEPMLRTLRGSLPGYLLAPAADGVGADNLKTMASIGVSLQRDGTLAFDSTKLKDASQTQLVDVRAMLGDRMAAVSTYVDGISQSGSGAIDQREQALDTQSATLTARIADLDSRLDKKRTALLVQYSKYEATLGRLKSLSDAVSAQISGMNSKSSS